MRQWPSQQSLVIVTLTFLVITTGILGKAYPETRDPQPASKTTQTQQDSPTAGKVLLLGKKKEFANVLRSVKWTFGQISVCWENPEAAEYDDLKMIRLSIADTWEKYSGVKFSGWGACKNAKNSHIRVFLADSDPQVNGLGNQISGKPNGILLNVTFRKDPYLKKKCTQDQSMRNKCIRGMAIHEFGHVLGFAHEQNREDTPKWCKDYNGGITGDWTSSVWDRNSVMNYCSNAHEGPQAWPLRDTLSEIDILAAQLLYGLPIHK